MFRSGYPSSHIKSLTFSEPFILLCRHEFLSSKTIFTFLISAQCTLLKMLPLTRHLGMSCWTVIFHYVSAAMKMVSWVIFDIMSLKGIILFIYRLFNNVGGILHQQRGFPEWIKYSPHCNKSITNHSDLLTWKWCIAFDIMKSYVWQQHLSHAVKQGMKSDLVHDLKCEVCKAHLNHVESVSFV